MIVSTCRPMLLIVPFLAIELAATCENRVSANIAQMICQLPSISVQSEAISARVGVEHLCGERVLCADCGFEDRER